MVQIGVVSGVVTTDDLMGLTGVVSVTLIGTFIVTPAPTPQPPPPPYNSVPAAVGSVVAVVGLGVIVLIAALLLKKKYFTSTPKRFDVDYVMMNTQLLTIPLHQLQNEFPLPEEYVGDDDAKAEDQ
jgi:hypothetical protein